MSLTKQFIILKQHWKYFSQNQRVNAFDITVFLRQFATLISAGIPIIQSCDILEKSQEKRALRLLIYSIKRDILSGHNLYSSLKSHPTYFDLLTCHLVQIGEHTGQLEMMLITIANYQEKNLAFKKKVKQALFYPCIITLTALMVTFSMFIFVIPRFAELFHDMQDTLPLLTVCLFYLSDKLQQYVFLWLACTFFSIVIFIYAMRTTNAQRYLQQIIAQLPLIKPCLHKITLARFARNLAITFAAGIPITDALKLAANTNNNIEFTRIIAELRSKISSGLQLHHAMLASNFFPVLMIQMVKIGEESGMFELMLDKIADFFESDIEQLIGRLNHLLEPLIMLVLGVLIGGLVIGMYLPIFKLGSAL